MLTLTENASTIVTTLVDQAARAEDAPADLAGLRLSHEGQSIAVAPVLEPVDGDQVVEDGGATVYLEQAAAVALADQVLDAAVDEGGAVQFSITPASPTVA